MKIKIYKHSSLKTQIDDDIAKIIPYFKSDFVKQYIDINLSIDIENTSLPYNDSNIIDKNEGKYDCVMIIYEKGTFNIYGATYPHSKKLSVCCVSVNPTEDRIDYSWKVMVHELLHAIWYKTMNDNNVIIPNLLDSYIKNDDPYALDGNFAQQLKVLKPYFMPIVTITRNTSDTKQTIGKLRTNDGGFGCDTLELAWKDNKSNISCIPTGKYTCKWTRSLRFPLGSYQVMDVNGRSGIRFHTGNFYTDIEGCILLGSLPKDINSDGEVDLQNSSLIISAFNKYMGKKDFTLIIK